MKQVKEFIPSQIIWKERLVLDKVNEFCKKNNVVDIIPKTFIGVDGTPLIAYIVIYEVEK